jgi:hypothetical protein
MSRVHAARSAAMDAARSQPQLSTIEAIARHVQALGGRLDLVANFTDHTRTVTTTDAAWNAPSSNDQCTSKPEATAMTFMNTLAPIKATVQSPSSAARMPMTPLSAAQVLPIAVQATLSGFSQGNHGSSSGRVARADSKLLFG